MTLKLNPDVAKAHVPRLVLRRHVQQKIHGDSLAGRINNRIAVGITRAVGSMGCAYLFALIALISLPAVIRSHNPLIIVAWVAQTFLQLVLLPIIIVGQNVQAATNDARAESDHETLLAIHTLTAEVYDLATKQADLLKKLEEKVDR